MDNAPALPTSLQAQHQQQKRTNDVLQNTDIFTRYRQTRPRAVRKTRPRAAGKTAQGRITGRIACAPSAAHSTRDAVPQKQRAKAGPFAYDRAFSIVEAVMLIPAGFAGGFRSGLVFGSARARI